MVGSSVIDDGLVSTLCTTFNLFLELSYTGMWLEKSLLISQKEGKYTPELAYIIIVHLNRRKGCGSIIIDGLNIELCLMYTMLAWCYSHNLPTKTLERVEFFGYNNVETHPRMLYSRRMIPEGYNISVVSRILSKGKISERYFQTLF